MDIKKIEIKILKLLEEREMVGLTLSDISRRLKIDPRLLLRILFKFANAHLIEERHTIDYTITGLGKVYLKKLK